VNRGTTARTLYIEQSKVYSLDRGQTRRRTYQLAPGNSIQDIWTLASSEQWYDLNVTLAFADKFLFQYAGHVETGKASKTDPAIGPMCLSQI
jgi:phospholipase C